MPESASPNLNRVSPHYFELGEEFFPPGRDTGHPGFEDELRRQRQDIRPDIRTREQFELACASGVRRATGLILERGGDPVLDAEGLQQLHGWMFSDVYNHAGQLARSTRLVDGLVGADPGAIPGELKLLVDQFRGLSTLWAFERELTEDAIRRRIEGIAFYHGRLLRIHPFNDGNGRLSRLVAQWQELALLGLHPRSVRIPRQDYLAALKALNHDMAPLMNYFIRRDGSRISLESSPRIPPFPMKNTVPVPGW